MEVKVPNKEDRGRGDSGERVDYRKNRPFVVSQLGHCVFLTRPSPI